MKTLKDCINVPFWACIAILCNQKIFIKIRTKVTILYLFFAVNREKVHKIYYSAPTDSKLQAKAFAKMWKLFR